MSNPDLKRKSRSAEQTRAAFAEVERVLKMTQQRVLKDFSERAFIPAEVLKDWVTTEPEACWPATVFEERKTEYVVSIALPGFDPTSTELTATPLQLTIRAINAERSPSRRIVESRRIDLPKDCEGDNLTASLHNGVLTIILRKRPLAEGKVPASTVPCEVTRSDSE